jgi:alpha,alpha-trehalose phosphorylase
VRDFDGRLSSVPRLPRAWNELAFSLRFCGRQLRVKLTHDEERYLVEEGEPPARLRQRAPRARRAWS